MIPVSMSLGFYFGTGEFFCDQLTIAKKHKNLPYMKISTFMKMKDMLAISIIRRNLILVLQFTRLLLLRFMAEGHHGKTQQTG